MTKINWGKILAAVTAGLGLVLQASQELGSISLPGKWNIIVAGAGLLAADILYRSGEDLGQDLTRRKLACDLLGVLGRVSVDFKF